MILYSLADLDDLLPSLDPGEEPTAIDGHRDASDLEVDAFLDRYKDCDYPRALTRAVEGIDDTVRRQGGARHPSLRLFLWQALGEAMVGAYPARQAVEEGYARWQTHLKPGERRPRHELRDWRRWQVSRVAARSDLQQVRDRLDRVFGVETMFTSLNGQSSVERSKIRAIIHTADGLDVRPTPQLIRGWFPRAEVCILAGKPGAGKGIVLADIIARGTRGLDMPNGDRIVKAFRSAVICLPGEDSENEWARRLQVADARLDCVQLVEKTTDDAGNVRSVDASTVVAVVEDVAANSAELIVIDSLTGLSNTDRLDTNKGEIRRILDDLSGVARRYDLTIAIIHHSRKAEGDPLDILQGNTQIGAAARSVLVTVEERVADGAEPDVHLFGVAKLNGSRRSRPVGFRTIGVALLHADGHPMRDDRGDVAHVPRVDWVTDRTFTQGELIAACHGTVLRDQGRDQAAIDILANGPMPSKKFIEEMTSAGYTAGAIRSARDRVGGVLQHGDRWWTYPKTMGASAAKGAIVALDAEDKGEGSNA